MTGFLIVMWVFAAAMGTMLVTCLRDDIKWCKSERLKQNPDRVMAQWDVDFIASTEENHVSYKKG